MRKPRPCLTSLPSGPSLVLQHRVRISVYEGALFVTFLKFNSAEEQNCSARQGNRSLKIGVSFYMTSYSLVDTYGSTTETGQDSQALLRLPVMVMWRQLTVLWPVLFLTALPLLSPFNVITRGGQQVLDCRFLVSASLSSS
jgi:hypothetical protein